MSSDDGILEIEITEANFVGDALTGHMEYIVTGVTTLPLYHSHQFSVKRRFRDFDWLRTELAAAYPGVAVPIIPEKNLIASKLASEESLFIERRKHSLERFLKRVALHPQLRTSTHLRYFLDYPDPIRESKNVSTQFSAALKNIMGDVVRVVTTIPVQISPEEDQWFEKTEKAFASMHSHLKALHGSIEVAIEDLSQLGVTTATLSKHSTEMGKSFAHHTALSSVLLEFGMLEASFSLRANEQARDLTSMADSVHEWAQLVSVIEKNFRIREQIFTNWFQAKLKYQKRKEHAKRIQENPHSKEDEKIIAVSDAVEARDQLKQLRDEFREFTNNVVMEANRFSGEQANEFRLSMLTYVQRVHDRQSEIVALWKAFVPLAAALDQSQKPKPTTTAHPLD